MTQTLLENLFSTKNLVAALGGAAFTALGVLVLFQNTFTPSRFHWWAMFILLPTFFFWGLALFVAHARAPYQASLTLFGLGLVILTVAAIFLLNLSWARWWPLMVITPALIVFLLGLPSSSLAARPEVAAWVSLVAWVGFATLLLGITFQVGNFGLIDLGRWTKLAGWWGVFIGLCGFGAAFNGLWLWAKMGEFSVSVLGLGVTAMMFLIAALFEWFRLDWWLWGYWMAILSGLGMVLSAFLFGKKQNNDDSTEDATSPESGRNQHAAQ